MIANATLLLMIGTQMLLYVPVSIGLAACAFLLPSLIKSLLLPRGCWDAVFGCLGSR